MNLLSIILSFLLLFQGFSFNIGNLSQYKELVEHVQYHQQEYGENLFTFIAKHYGALAEHHSHDNPDEQNEHENLPFQNNHSISTSVVIAISTSASTLKLKLNFSTVKLIINPLQQYNSPALEKLLQPPIYA